MREKELRLALVCYGGIILAVYMHGVTKEIWHLTRASRAELDGADPSAGVIQVYRDLLTEMGATCGLKLRVLVDIIAGASAGGINGVFLSRAIATGESLEPLTGMWLDKADVTVLLDPDARPLSRFSKFWAVPIAWLATRGPKNVIDTTVERGARAEVRRKLSQFVRARWFQPPFGGPLFSGLLLDAFAAMRAGPKGHVLIPPDQPIDLIVTVTDYAGYAQIMRLNSPTVVEENEHRLLLGFRHAPGGERELDDVIGLTFAARATASFPGAFPPFSAREIDRTLEGRGENWPQRDDFLTTKLKGGGVDDRVLIDGSVLSNAPFRPAIRALKQRPARREVDRRFVYIDPKPGQRSFALTGGNEKAELPGFFMTILKAMSDIPREQPIRESVEAIESISEGIGQMRRILEAMRTEVDERVEAAVDRTFFLDKPTPSRLAAWRAKTQARAVAEGGYAYSVYGHAKLTLVIDEMARIAAGVSNPSLALNIQDWRNALWAWAQSEEIDHMHAPRGKDENPKMVAFFRAQDTGYRIRRMRLLARRLDEVAGLGSGVPQDDAEAVRRAIYQGLGLYLDREATEFYKGIALPDGALRAPASVIEAFAARKGLDLVDTAVDTLLAETLVLLPKGICRQLVKGYLGFPFYDAASLPLLQGEGDGEFDPIKIDRISPEDASRLRAGGAVATLKGIQFNSFGAFFSRSFRENDYLWGRLHAAERLISIVASTAPAGHAIPPDRLEALRDRALAAILNEEAGQLREVAQLIDELQGVLKPERASDPG